MAIKKEIKRKSKAIKGVDKKELFLKALFANAGFVIRACEDAGISRQTYYNWIDEESKYYDEEFAKEVQGVFSDFDHLAESQLIRNIQEGKETSLIFYLKNRNPEKWNDRRIVKHEGEVGVSFRDKLSKLQEIINDLQAEPEGEESNKGDS